MAIKFFLMYIGGLLTCSIVFLTIVKRFAEGFAAGGKKPVVYGSLSAIIASAAAYGATLFTKHLFTLFWVFAAIFLLFGIIHMIMNRKYFSSGAGENSKVFFGEIIFATSVVLFTVVVFSSLQYFLADRSFLFYPMMMSALLFFVPLLVVHTFQAAYTIPEPVFSTWTYPVNDPIPLPEDNPREKLLVIGFEIAKKNAETKRTFFRAKAPENIALGELYYHFINDYNELQSETPIEFCDNKDIPCEWGFRLKPKWYQGQRILNPSLTIRDNGIKENAVIICERLN